MSSAGAACTFAFRCQLYTGRRADVDRLRERLEQL
jgi:hypothetical protein